MDYKNLEKILNEYNFIKLKNKEQYCLTTHLVLNETNNNLNIYATISNNKITLSDNSQFLDGYDNIIDYDYIVNKKIKPNLKNNIKLESNSIQMLANELRFGLEISDFIKTIVLLENKLSNM